MHYVIIGNGVAGVTAAFTLRERDRQARITLISGESDFFISRTALMYAFMDKLTLRDLEPHERKVYDVQRISRVRGWVSDLDANRKRLTLKDGRILDFDRLLIATGSTPNRPHWRGISTPQSGIVHFVSLQDLAEAERLAATARRAVVVGGGLIGVELVECLHHHAIPVTFLVRDPWYWPAALDDEEGELIGRHIESHGVDVRVSETVDEVFAGPEGRVRGLRTQAGTRFDCDLLGIAIGVRPSIDWLQGVATPPALSRGILIADNFRTGLEDVWAAGDCAELVRPGNPPLVEQIWYSAKRQGELAARSMLGEPIRYEPPAFYNSAKFFEVEYTTVGRVRQLPSTARSFYCKHPASEASIRIVEDEGAVIGFNMLGSRWDHTRFERWIRMRASLDEVMQRLHEAQFDVEFGRLDLDPIRNAYRARKEKAA
jgi:NAD(P)H-nitrite reductase large subunit